MYKYKFLQAGQLPREHVFLAKSAELFYHKIFSSSNVIYANKNLIQCWDIIAPKISGPMPDLNKSSML